MAIVVKTARLKAATNWTLEFMQIDRGDWQKSEITKLHHLVTIYCIWTYGWKSVTALWESHFFNYGNETQLVECTCTPCKTSEFNIMGSLNLFSMKTRLFALAVKAWLTFHNPVPHPSFLRIHSILNEFSNSLRKYFCHSCRKLAFAALVFSRGFKNCKVYFFNV